MITIRAHVAEGHTSISMEGHENHVEQGRICAAATAVLRTALLGLEQLAMRHPQHVQIRISEERPT